MQSLRATWAALAAASIPPNAPAETRTQMESSFYAGANVVLRMLDEAASADTTGDKLQDTFDRLRNETGAYIEAASGQMNGVGH